MFNAHRRNDRHDHGHRRSDMFQATCGNCGKNCEVPFRPVNGRPVYCADCFKKNSPSRFDDRKNDRSRDDRKMYDAVCASCGDHFELPFRPNGEKPVYCRACFVEKPAGAGKGSASDDQIRAINSKLDQILKTLNAIVTSAPVAPAPAELPAVAKLDIPDTKKKSRVKSAESRGKVKKAKVTSKKK